MTWYDGTTACFTVHESVRGEIASLKQLGSTAFDGHKGKERSKACNIPPPRIRGQLVQSFRERLSRRALSAMGIHHTDGPSLIATHNSDRLASLSSSCPLIKSPSLLTGVTES